MKNVMFPAHKGALFLTHNEHKNEYATVGQWLNEQGDELADFPDESERQKAIVTDELWMLQWYPDTPVGFKRVCAASFDRLMELVTEEERDGKA